VPGDFTATLSSVCSSDLFCRCVRDAASTREPAIEVHVALLIGRITHTVYGSVCRGLFERDKQLFALLGAAMIARAAGAISAPEWRLFLAGVPEANADAPADQPARPSAMSAGQWRAARALEELRRGPVQPASRSAPPSLPSAVWAAPNEPCSSRFACHLPLTLALPPV